MKIFLINDNLAKENCYIVLRDNEVTIIDPGFNYEKIEKIFTDSKYELKNIFLTHGHIDHTGCMDQLIKNHKDVKIYINELDVELLFNDTLNCSKIMGMSKVYPKNMNLYFIKNKEEIDGFIFHHTPGHTKGSMVIELNDLLFTGDTLFKNSIGRTDLPSGSMVELKESLDYIRDNFSKKTIILPGHMGKSTLKEEIKNNPYLKKKRGLFG